jgi:hypothetical protein
MEKTMKWRFTFLGAFVVLALCPFSSPILAQTAEATTKSSVILWYDVTKEVTLTGTVSSAVEKGTPGMKMLGGSHLFVETASGKVIDASLGSFAMRGEGALSVASGEQIQLTGVLKVIKGTEVLFTRLVRANGRVYKIRNEHGFARTSPSTDSGVIFQTKGAQQ